jgi:deoxyhypusine synthase
MEPELAKDAVLVESESLPSDTPQANGYDWNQGLNYDKLLSSFKNTGFQATNFGKAVEEINKMIECREKPLDNEHKDDYEEDEFIKRTKNCTIFLGYTSNIVSSGLRETIRFLVQHKMIDCIVATAGKVQLFPLILKLQNKVFYFFLI